MRRRWFGLIVLVGCAQPPPAPPLRCIGVTEDAQLVEVFDVLAHHGIAGEEGDGNLGVTGVCVPERDAEAARRILFEWRRDRRPWAFVTPEEFRMTLP